MSRLVVEFITLKTFYGTRLRSSSLHILIDTLSKVETIYNDVHLLYNNNNEDGGQKKKEIRK